MRKARSGRAVAPENVHGPEDFAAMRRAGRLAAEVLDYIGPHVQPGVRTDELDRLCDEYTRRHGATSAPLGYMGYPKATCISPNEVVCHGIPGERRLVSGDCVNIDVTVILDGWYGDSNRMFHVGEVAPEARRLTNVTYACLMAAIDVVRPGATFGDIGHVIQQMAEAEGFSVVRNFAGHGLGRVFHCDPVVLHYGRPGQGDVIRKGMFFTIEPMINAGRYGVKVLDDGWTAVTKDRSLSAQFEHTLGVTDEGCEIFTLSPAGRMLPE